MRKLKNLFFLLTLVTISLSDEVQVCDKDEDLIGGVCYIKCSENVCGDHATCHQRKESQHEEKYFCMCLRGYTGDARTGCFKMDETSPCSPDPCGPNSECIAEHAEIGPHCKCLNDFIDFPPNCRTGCKSNADCKVNHVCDSNHRCVDLCANAKCGPNSVCRVDKDTSYVHCSCKDGFFPQKGVGCREKKAEDFEIQCVSTFGCESDELCVGGKCIKSPCAAFCGDHAGCNIHGGKVECYCDASAKDEQDNPYDACKPISNLSAALVAVLAG